MQEVIHVAVADWGTGLSTAEVDQGIQALQTQLDRDFAPTWGVRARLTALRPVLPEAGVWGLILHPGKPDSAPLHFEGTTSGQPVAEVFLGALEAGQQWTHAASRALLEMVVDPVASRGVLGPSRDVEVHTGWLWAHDVTAPCGGYQHGYQISGRQVSDFVRPAWFGAGEPTRGFDHCGRIHQAFGVLEGELTYAYDLRKSVWFAVGATSVATITQPPSQRLARFIAALAAPRTFVGTPNPHPQEGGVWGGP
jgi:hypothetical protein